MLGALADLKWKVLTHNHHEIYMMPVCRVVTLTFCSNRCLCFSWVLPSAGGSNVSQVMLTWLCSTLRAMLMTPSWTLRLQCVWWRRLSTFSLQVAPSKMFSPKIRQELLDVCCIVATCLEGGAFPSPTIPCPHWHSTCFLFALCRTTVGRGTKGILQFEGVCSFLVQKYSLVTESPVGSALQVICPFGLTASLEGETARPQPAPLTDASMISEIKIQKKKSAAAETESN